MADLKLLAHDAVADYRERHPSTLEHYRQLDACDALERLMDKYGSKWIEDKAAELGTARRVRGEK